LTVNAGNGGFLHCIQMDTSVNAANQVVSVGADIAFDADPKFFACLVRFESSSGLRMFLLLITFLKASHSFRNRLLVICKNAYLFATMIMTSVSSPFSCCSGIVRLNLM